MHNRSKLKWNRLFWNPFHDPVNKMHYYITFSSVFVRKCFYQIYCTEDFIFFCTKRAFHWSSSRKNFGRKKKQTLSLNHSLISCWLLGKSQSNRSFLRKLFFFAFSDTLWTYTCHMIFTVEKVSFSSSFPNPNNTYISFSIYIYCT